ncbi:FHA domain-containing protein [Collimonas sp.]|jgi:hypothetical protein|uniref:FHA domain-containing protein n=1 Tax=Collimonas sp. TaxID=1963772 RepID=UPI002C0E1450|nr:FHA domain-containing protein [Collimonas sp.]HWW03969.1 FHA domain-containing protein [Collimonas sp.]
MTQKTLRILSGFNQGAEVSLELGVPFILGCQSDCSLVLVDEGVEAQHCQLLLTVAGLICTALNGSLTIQDKQLTPSETVKIAYMQSVRCGSIDFIVGDKGTDWASLQTDNAVAALMAKNKSERSWRSGVSELLSMPRWKRNVVLGGGAIGFLAVMGIAYAAMLPSSAYMSQSYLTEARLWLKSIAPAGSELRIDRTQGGELALSGYVGSNYQNELLTMAVHNSSYHPKIEVHSVEQMVSSLSRLANLENLPCIVNYRGAGRLGCNNEIDEQAQAVRLQVLARQVVGVKALEARVRPEQVSDVAAPQTSPVPETSRTAPPASAGIGTIANFPRKLSILMSKRGRYVIDSSGLKFSEGDVVDGFALVAIEIDQVELERNGQRFLVRVGNN